MGVKKGRDLKCFVNLVITLLKGVITNAKD